MVSVPGCFQAERGTGEHKSEGHTLESEAGSCRGFYESTFKEEKKSTSISQVFVVLRESLKMPSVQAEAGGPGKSPDPIPAPAIVSVREALQQLCRRAFDSGTKWLFRREIFVVSVVLHPFETMALARDAAGCECHTPPAHPQALRAQTPHVPHGSQGLELSFYRWRAHLCACKHSRFQSAAFSLERFGQPLTWSPVCSQVEREFSSLLAGLL